MILKKKSDKPDTRTAFDNGVSAAGGQAMTRRSFLLNSSLMTGGAALASTFSPVMMKKASAKTSANGAVDQVKTVCTHCSVGCGIVAEVRNGVWVGQEPAFDHPFNRG
ncbi:MAG TPA: formate dehydrogenase, partial [Chromatiales bacterium]|nr:formate dehydrogenase [Chromatiales bacterium]